MQQSTFQTALEAFLASRDYVHVVQAQKRSGSVWHVCLFPNGTFSVELSAKADTLCLPLDTEMLGTIAAHSREMLRDLLRKSLAPAATDPNDPMIEDVPAYVQAQIATQHQSARLTTRAAWVNQGWAGGEHIPAALILSATFRLRLEEHGLGIVECDWTVPMAQSRADTITAQLLERAATDARRKVEERLGTIAAIGDAAMFAAKLFPQSGPSGREPDNDYSMDSPLTAGGDSDSW